MNKVILMGRLTRDPEVRYTTNNNTLVCTFSIAVNRRFKQEGQPDADFFNIVAWSKTGEFCSKYFKKGQQVGIVGRLQTRNYDDKDGKKVYVTEVIAEETYFADSRRDGEGGSGSSFNGVDAPFNSAEGASDFTPVTDDDLPF
ncbi:MAG: single-stranded DNA-binding protein [Clostridia bacterium]|nr:single-stranded DNA-binding protein [Clostridia bacterium]